MQESAASIVIDTNVVSYIFMDDPRASYYREQIRGRRPVLSFQTLEELWFGAFMGHWDGANLIRHLDSYTVVWPTPELVDICARLRSAARLEGRRRLSAADAWIEATAIMLNCPLATNDEPLTTIPNLDVITIRLP